MWNIEDSNEWLLLYCMWLGEIETSCSDRVFNLLQIDKILALSKLKAFAKDKFILAHMVQCLFEKVRNIVGKV